MPKEEPVMTMQLQSWNTVGAAPCMEHPTGAAVPGRVGTYYKTPRPQPWRPTLGYENVEVTPLPTQPVTNASQEPSYAPAGMAMEPLRFPNLVTGIERNPGHAARAALYARYTPFEWTQNSISHFNEADTNRNYAERLRSDAFRMMRESDEKAVAGQREAGRRLGERITDTTFWRNEVSIELEKVIAESNMLQDKRRELEKVIQDCEGPLHIAQECLYQRENRKGIDVVHDQVEQALLHEVENLRNCIDRFKNLHEQTLQQLRNNRALQHELERDQKSKESALGIDNMCHQLNNFSRGVNYYRGIEKHDPTVTVPETWAEHSKGIVERSQNERSKSAQLRVDIDNLINAGANDIWNAWNTTNNALERRSIEILEAKSKLQMHLHKLQQEIFDMEKSMELLRKSLLDKNQYLKVAQTRLEARTHRRDVELCRDNAQVRLVNEVKDIEDSMAHLNRKLQEAEAQHQQLLKTRSNMEIELQNKVNTLFIDREKCLGMRRSFPITATLKY